ncbi:hypothetical protein HY218_02065, partial [Candidatus Saccharibacteria bacterium]|nr:hypothetical protein [Candidatus Saccharibacteria bacterium]
MQEDQWRSEYAPLDLSPSAAVTTSPSVPPRPHKRVPWKWVAGASLFVTSLVVGIVLLKSHVDRSAQIAKSNQIKTQDVDLGNLSNISSQLKVDNSDKVIVNGQLQANQGLIITPTNQPTTAVLGEIYVDAKTGQVNYYDGKQYNSLITTSDLANALGNIVSKSVLSLQGLTGALTLISNSNALGIDGSSTQISLSLQNASTAEKGIAQFNGTNFTASAGVINTIQNIDVNASPIFAGLTLNAPLAISSGGTGVANFNANGVIISDNSGGLESLTENNSGLCLVSGVGVGGGPGFTNCNGTKPVASLDGLIGDLIITNSSGAGSTITINNASTGSKGIAQFNSTDFSASGGVIDTIQGISSSATPTFAGLSLTSPLNITSGGTGGSSAASARSNLGAAASGANADITQTSNLNTIIPSTTLTVGSTSQSFTLQGDELSVISATSGSFTTIVGFTTPSDNRNIVFPDGSGTVCLTSGNCNSGSSVTSLDGLSGVLNLANSSGSGSTITIDNASTSAKGIAQFNSTNFSVASGVVDTIQGISTAAAPTFAGLTLSSPLAIASGGTGATNSSGARSNLGAAASGANNDITSTSALNDVTPNAAFHLGATGQTFTLQGDSSSAITATGNGFLTTIGFTGTAIADVTYNFDRSASTGNYLVCTTAGNCSGTGNVTSPGGTTGQIAKFTGAQTIGDSILSESGGTLTVAGAEVLNTSLALKNGTNTNKLILQAGITAGGDLTFTLPIADGNNGQCLSTNGSGVLAFSDCLSGSGGGSGGVTSLDGLSGVLTISNSSGSGSTVTIDNASTSAKGIAQFNSTNFSASSGTINTIQGISTAAAPTFAGLTLTGNLSLGTSNTISSNTLQQTASGQNVTVNAGTNELTLHAHGIDFILPSTGAASQTICTTGISCVAGGGQAVLLAPGSAQTDSATDVSIFINDTGGGNLLELQSSGTDKFTVANNGDTTIAGILSTDTITTASSGADQLTINANGRAYILPTTGGASQTICTTAISCVAGGGQALLLAPGSAQTNNSAADSSLFVNNTSTANLIQLQGSGVDKFTVASNGNTTIAGSLSVTGLSSGVATIGGGGTFSSVASVPVNQGGTGSTTAAGARSNLSAAVLGANNDITSTTALNTITPSGALIVGATSQSFTLQGSSASVITATSGSFKTTLNFATPTANVTYTFPTAATGTYNICTSIGNCASAGGGVTTSGGTIG